MTPFISVYLWKYYFLILYASQQELSSCLLSQNITPESKKTERSLSPKFYSWHLDSKKIGHALL